MLFIYWTVGDRQLEKKISHKIGSRPLGLHNVGVQCGNKVTLGTHSGVCVRHLAWTPFEKSVLTPS
jgi:hypothetical protein